MTSRFGIVLAVHMTNAALSMEARALYAILTTFCNKERSCFPSTRMLMKITGKSRATIFRWLKELENGNLIRKTHEGRKRVILLSDQLPQETEY